MKAMYTRAPMTKATKPPMNAPPIPTAIVSPIDIGLGPGMARRPRAPTISPVITRLMRKEMKVMALSLPLRRLHYQGMIGAQPEGGARSEVGGAEVGGTVVGGAAASA